MQILHVYLSSSARVRLLLVLPGPALQRRCMVRSFIGNGPLQTADGKETARTGRGDPLSVNRHFHAPNHVTHTNAKQKVYIYISKSA